MIAEFGMMYGWDAIQAVLDNKITGETFTWLLEAGRKVEKKSIYNQAKASFMGSVAAGAKKPGDAFNKITSKLVSSMRADNE